MGLFFGRKRTKTEERKEASRASIEVIELKSKTHKSAQHTKREIDKLNKILNENHITLLIKVAAGGNGGRN